MFMRRKAVCGPAGPRTGKRSWRGSRRPSVADTGLADEHSEGRRILVVDDNRDAAESLAPILRMFGNEVDTVFDGAAAVAAIPKFRPDVVLMDIGMPNLDGYQAARAIRMGPDGGEVVLIALTGWGSDVDQYKSNEAGFDRHLVKPVMPKELLEILHRR
jgi:CheY-like chemotaxis protein